MSSLQFLFCNKIPCQEQLEGERVSFDLKLKCTVRLDWQVLVEGVTYFTHSLEAESGNGSVKLAFALFSV